ncbi:MAG: polyhydroxyalkanoate synthesis repressor PhaR [Gammaproteobacteria bacterium]|nr:polyhydroxyalkanoate synthesis repressor PhaR [Gammaproteobacteria bacterium]
MSDIRVIKKYPNRRLYDTERSKYITLEDVKKLVMEGTSFCVKDVKTDEDLTRTILLQIISEQEHNGEPLFSTQALTQLIRCYGQTYQNVISEYLQNSIDIFTQQQKEFQDKLQETVATNPFTAMNDLTERNLKMWQDVQENFFKATASGNSSKDNK